MAGTVAHSGIAAGGRAGDGQQLKHEAVFYYSNLRVLCPSSLEAGNSVLRFSTVKDLFFFHTTFGGYVATKAKFGTR